MPRPWIKIEPAIVQHPKTRQLAKLWGCHSYHVVGFLVALWGYCLEYQEDGNVDGLPPDVLDEFAAPCLNGAHQSVRDALQEVGFVDAGGRLHDWDEYTGELIERRRRDRERKRLARRSGRQESTQAVRRTERGHGADGRRTSRRRVEQSRVETTPPTPSSPAPRATWLTPYFDAWVAKYGGKPAAGALARYLKPLHGERGSEKVLTHWRNYLASTEARFASPARFAATFGSWAEPGASGKPDPSDPLPGESPDEYLGRQTGGAYRV